LVVHMDFKEILQAEISAKRKLYKDKAGPRKYIRRGELEATEGGAEVGDIEGRVEAGDRRFSDTKASDADIDTRSEALSQTMPSASPPTTSSAPSPIMPSASPPTTSSSPSKMLEEALLVGAMETEPITAESIKDNPSKLCTLISLFLRRLVREQGAVLAQRSPEDRNTKEGKLATTIYLQCQDHLKPLFKHLRKDLLPADVLYSLATICGFMQQREYVRANDMYLKLAIGNAPWPIGVTAVGIHEKIKSNQVAHVLNDEVSRKWIQAVKRLMTFCQSVYPSTDRSKMVSSLLLIIIFLDGLNTKEHPFYLFVLVT
jgi:hypothetical protein